jgi:hypothetical protein
MRQTENHLSFKCIKIVIYLKFNMPEQYQTWFSGLGVLHFLILQTVRKAKLILWQLGHSQSLSRPAPTENSQ